MGGAAGALSSRQSSGVSGGGDGESDHFGAALASARLIEDGGSGLRVPAVLVCLWEELMSRPQAEGVGSEGIFRLSADQAEVNSVRDAGGPYHRAIPDARRLLPLVPLLLSSS